MENTNLENEVVVEEETITVIPKIYNISDKEKVSMLGAIRNDVKDFTLANLDTVDLSTYEVVDKKYLVKQVAVCGTTDLPMYLKLEMVFTNVHPSELAKKGKTTTEKPTTLYKAINL